MNTNKFSLIFDGNYFFFKTLHVIPKIRERILEDEEDLDIYIKKLSTDFASIIKKFRPIIDQVVFTLDSSSWRKDYYPDLEYKSNRKNDESINWENFSNSMKIFTEILQNNGVIINKVSGAEGDDLCYLWSSYCNNNSKNAIIFSGDRDLMQLVNYQDSTDSITLFYTSAHNKLVSYDGFSKFLKEKEEINIFNMSDSVSVVSNTKRIFNNLIEEENLEILEINSSDYVFKKILTGDRGDNIKSVYHTNKVTKGGQSRNYGISEKKSELILSEFNRMYGEFNILYLFNSQYRNDIINIVIRVMKADKMSKEEILENLNNNTSLILLHNKTLPEQLQNAIYSIIESDFAKTSNLLKLDSANAILENTKYIKSNISYGGLSRESNSDLSFIKDRKNVNNNNSLF